MNHTLYLGLLAILLGVAFFLGVVIGYAMGTIGGRAEGYWEAREAQMKKDRQP